jgi:hypothetical protein
MTQEEEHLRLLSIFHYVVAGLVALFSLFPIFHLIFGLFIVFAPGKVGGKEDEAAAAALFGWAFVLFAAALIAVGLAFAACVFAAGRFLAKRKHYLFCLAMAGVECMFMPLGTVLGVFTIITLVREPVKQLFKGNAALQPSTTAA